MAKLSVVLFIGYMELHSQAWKNVSARSMCAGNTEHFQHYPLFSCGCTLQYFFLNHKTALSFQFHVLCCIICYLCNMYVITFVYYLYYLLSYYTTLVSW